MDFIAPCNVDVSQFISLASLLKTLHSFMFMAIEKNFINILLLMVFQFDNWYNYFITNRAFLH